MIDLIALLIKFVGVVFLGIAAIGLIRFEDPFQRMHAATKAGTLGAGLVLVGTVINIGTFDAATTGLMALIFLFLTVPIASHLLARASYISGAPLIGVGEADALSGVIERADIPLEAAMEELGFDACDPDAVPGGARPDAIPHGPASLKAMIAPERVRFAAVGDDAPTLARRAAGFAARAGLPLTAVVAVDTSYADTTTNRAETMRQIRDKASHWLPDLRALSDDLGVPIDLVYQEGDAEAIMAGVGDVSEFLVLPTDGWADYGAGLRSEKDAEDTDGLLRMHNLHPGPVMYAVDETKTGPVAVQFDGSFNVWRGLELALAQGLWTMTELRVYGETDAASRAEIERRAEAAKVPVRFTVEDGGPHTGTILPAGVMEDAIAVILPDLPRPLRVRADGAFWQDRIAPGWRGDVLVWT